MDDTGGKKKKKEIDYAKRRIDVSIRVYYAISS